MSNINGYNVIKVIETLVGVRFHVLSMEAHVHTVELSLFAIVSIDEYTTITVTYFWTKLAKVTL